MLYALLERDFRRQFRPTIFQRVRRAQADFFRPLRPRLPAETVFQGHEQRVIVQPTPVLYAKALIIRVGGFAGRERLTQKRETPFIEDFVVNAGRVGGRETVAILRGKQSLPYQLLQVNKVRVSGEGRERLIRRIAVPGGAEREYLPVGLSGVGEKIYPLSGVTRETADTVRPRQTEYGQ